MYSLEQPNVCSAGRQSFTEHVLAAAEDLSVWTVMHSTRRRCGVL